MRIIKDAEVVTGFTLEKPFQKLPGISHCGEAWCSRHHRLSPHKHKGIEAIFLTSGGLRWRAQKMTIPQEAGELVVFGPEVVHSTAEVVHPRFHALYAGIELDQFGSEGKKLQSLLEGKPAVNLGSVPESEQALKGLFRCALERSQASAVAQKFGEVLLAILIDRLSVRGQAPPPEAGAYSWAVRKALTHLRNNLARRVSISELAELCHHSVAHFAVVFTNEVGTPPAAFHRRMRLEAAREALRLPDASLAMIAADLGFVSSQHLGTLFKNAFGITPGAWLRQNRSARSKFRTN